MAQRKRTQDGRHTFRLTEEELATLVVTLGIAAYGPSKNGSAKKWEKFFRESRGDRVMQITEIDVLGE